MRFLLLFLSISLTYAEKERESDGATARVLRHQHSNPAKDDHKEDHEAILGSKREAEIFDELSSEEAKKRLKVLAHRMDLNSDGQIDKVELTAWIEKAIHSLDDEEADERMREIDENEDGLITLDEYINDSFPDADPSHKNFDAEDLKLLEEDKLYFAAADVNKDGKLSKDELTAFLNPENFEHMHKVLIELTLAEKDLNKDGAIDLKEFLGDVTTETKGEWHKEETKRFRTEYDQNGDGLLTGKELAMWLLPNTREVSVQEADHLMSNADKDGDGKLTIDEILDSHHVFVGSQATDYGEHLMKVRRDEL